MAPIGWPSAIAPPLTLTLREVGAGLLLPREHHRRERLVDLDRGRCRRASCPVFSSAYAVAGIGAVSMKIGSSPRTLRWWMRARGVSPCSLHRPLRHDEQRRGAVGDLARDRGGEPAALDERLERRHLLERRVAARTLVARRRRRAATISRSKRPSSLRADARARGSRARTAPCPRARCPTSRRSSRRRGTATPPACRSARPSPSSPRTGR